MTITTNDMPNLLAVLDDFRHDFEADYKAHLLEHDRKATGKLLDSITTRVVVGSDAFEVVCSLADYWKWVEEDTRPHWPPKGALLEWIKAKPVIPYPDSRGRVPSPESLDYLIRRKIARVGTKGSHDMRETREEIIARYRGRIAQALAADFTGYIMKALR